MAFNLVSHFRKYRKVWIVSVLFLCMITFVLCTGLGQGGLEDRILDWFGQMTHKGKEVAILHGRSIYNRELDEVKRNREIANEFMREALKITAREVEEILKAKDDEIKKGEKKGAELEELLAHQKGLAEVHKYLQDKLTSKPRYFDTGVKLDDLLNFMLWKKEADRVGVDLVENHVKEMIDLEVTLPIRLMNQSLDRDKVAVLHHSYFWGPKTALEAIYKVRETHPLADYDSALNALKDEFRVQITQFALSGYRGDPNPFASDFKKLGYEIRFPLTPHQLWKSYQEDLTKFDLVLLPVKAEHFIDKVPEPTTAQLQDLFKKYSNNRYNPASDEPGFIQPEKAKIQYLTADPESKHYKNLARLVTSLQATPPGFVDLGTGPLGTAARLGTGKHALNASLEDDYLHDITRYLKKQIEFFPFKQTPVTEAAFELALYTAPPPTPEMAAGLVGAMALPAQQMAVGLSGMPGAAPALLSDGPTGYQAAAWARHKDNMGFAVQEEIKRRVPVGVRLMLAGASPMKHTLLGSAAEFLEHGDGYTFLPFEAVAPHYVAKHERLLAGDFAKEVMESVYKYLNAPVAVGKAVEFNSRLNHLKKRYGEGIQVYESEGLIDQFDVDQDPGLEKLRQAYPDLLHQINSWEQRGLTNNLLTEADFYKLFFDSGEAFSLASSSPYFLQQWPPTIMPKNAVSLGQVGQADMEMEKGVKFSLWMFTDQRFLYWKSEAKEPRYPEKLEEVKDKVIEAWKFQEARKLAFAAAEEIAKKDLSRVQTLRKEYLPVLKEKAVELKVDLITLDRASKKAKVPLIDYDGNIFAWRYELAKLEKGLIPYPRETMSQEVFSLYNLKGPLDYYEAGEKDQPPGNDKNVDDLNKYLFPDDPKQRTMEDLPIQVLTNKPRSIYYVVVLNKVYPAELNDFIEAFARARAIGQESDYFIHIARSEEAMRFRELLTQQLRKKHLEIKDIEAFQ